MPGVQEERPLEVGEQSLGGDWAKDRPEQEWEVEEAGGGWRVGAGVLGEGVLGGEGPTWRWVR